jgi:hypothetical protein
MELKAECGMRNVEAAAANTNELLSPRDGPSEK